MVSRGCLQKVVTPFLVMLLKTKEEKIKGGEGEKRSKEKGKRGARK